MPVRAFLHPPSTRRGVVAEAQPGGAPDRPRPSRHDVVAEAQPGGAPNRPRPSRHDVVAEAQPGGAPDRRLAAIAAGQRGLVDSGDLRSSGLSRGMVAGRLAAGRLHRVHTGVYAVGHDGLDDLARHLAATMACPGSVLTAASGIAAWDLGDWPDVVVLRAPRVRQLDGARVRRSRRPVAATRRHGIPTAPVTDVLLDLAELEGEWTVTRALNEALFQRRTTVALVGVAVEAATGRHGVALLRRLLPLAGALHSVLEDQFLRLLIAARLPRPQPNRRVAGHRVDFWWPDARLVVETDGWSAHGTPLRFETDRARDADLLVAGVRVMRITRRQLLDEPHAVVARLAVVLLGRA